MKKLIKGLMTNGETLGEILSFFWSKKLYWLIPMIVLLLMLGLVVVLATSPVVAPFIYTLF